MKIQKLHPLKLAAPILLAFAALALFLAVTSRPTRAVLAAAQMPAAPSQSAICVATPDDGATVYASLDAGAVQMAVDEAAPGATVKIAGTCAGVQETAGMFQTVYISQAVTLQGGYTQTNWTVSDPAAYPTTLDAQGGGRVIFILSDTVTLDGLIVTEGSTNFSGAGIYNQGQLTLLNSIVHSNTTSEGGAGIMSRGPLVIQNSALVNNFGDGLMLNAFGSAGSMFVTITNTTIAENTSHGIANGGAVLQIVNSTIANNAAGFGSGILSWNVGPHIGTVNLDNTLVVNNSGANCTGTVFFSAGHNLDTDNTCSLDQPTDHPNDTIALGNLADNGGATWTMALLPEIANAHAVNGGDCAGGAITEDQRGVPRPQWFVCDIGAYEYDGPALLARDDHFQANAGTEISFNVLDNDIFLPSASITFTAIISPLNGALTNDGNGGFTYRPFPSLAGYDTFIYEITDGVYTDTAKVVITVYPASSPGPNLTLDWIATASPKVVAPADVNHDGNLDLAIIDGTVQIFMNHDGSLPADTEWEANDSGNARELAWGDVDLDGDLDLAVAISGTNKIYLNNQGAMDPNPAWESAESELTEQLAWGDINGDGWLDLVVLSPDGYRVYLSSSGTLTMTGSLTVTPAENLALGDIDGDGMLDLTLAYVSYTPTLRVIASVYPNTGGAFAAVPTSQVENVISWGAGTNLAWGDVDNDGDLDLALAHIEGAKIYLNVDGVLDPAPVWSWSNHSLSPLFISWGDINGDSLLDLLIDTTVTACGGVCVSRNFLFLNQNGSINPSASWVELGSRHAPVGASIFADMNSDGVMDLITIPDFIKRHTNSQPPAFNGWATYLEQGGGAQAWGDVDGDGDLDMAVSGSGAIYLNEHGRFNQFYYAPDLAWIAEAAWVGPGSVTSLAWGDMDGDGHLDLATGRGGENHVYLNQGTMLMTTTAWVSGESIGTNDLAWGDVDGDGDLDLAVADPDAVRLYANLSGTLTVSATWMSAVNDNQRIAWGDVDNDGNLDLAVSGDTTTRLYLNHNGTLDPQPAWQVEGSSSLDWGDMDDDGDLDLAVGRDGPDAVYQNVNGMLEDQPVWISLDADVHNVEVEWVDFNLDGYPDLLSINTWSNEPLAQIHLYTNVAGVLEQHSNFSRAGNQIFGSVADIDGDGDKDIAFYGDSTICPNCNVLEILYSQTAHPSVPPLPGAGLAGSISLHSDAAATFNGQSAFALAPADDYALAHVRTNTIIPITYTTFVAAQPALQVRGFYSLNGGGDWLPAVPTSDTLTTHIPLDGLPRVYKWDTFASGFFGQSDNVTFRLELAPGGHSAHGSPPVQQRPHFATQTNPFRVRGTQVRVLSGTLPAANAIIYRLPAGQTTGAEPMVGDDGKLLRTNLSGYLQGRGQINLGDTLYAMLPITYTDSYTLYYASGTPVEMGVNGHTMTAPGEQTLVVSPENPFMLFNPSVALEWDSRNDPAYLSQLTDDLQRASEVLFDISNGQIALGHVRVYQAKENWTGAHVLILAANDIRPSATMGGVVSEPLGEYITGTGVITDAYLPGQVRMGPTWSRFGDPNANLGEDWARALAHELGHFFLFLPDNYLGIDNGRLIPTDCFGSFMTDAYAEEYTEFLTEPDWVGPCLQTIAENVSGRTDWETITQFYPWLRSDTLLDGPNNLTLEVTSITFVEPEDPSTALSAPFFSLRDTENDPIFVPGGDGAGYLFKNWDTPELTDDYVVALGSPVGDQMESRGAEPGDRLCVYDYSQTPSRLGCDAVGPSEGEVILEPLPGWQPHIEIGVQAVTLTNEAYFTQTLALLITVTQEITGGDLYAQVMPVTGFSATFPITAVVAQLTPPDPGQPVSFTQLITMPYPTLEVFVRVWVEGSSLAQEAMTQFFLGGGWGGNRAAWGGNRAAWGGNRAAWGGNRAAWGAPVASGNGQVIVFNLEDIFGDTGTASLQALNSPPKLPSWMALVGQAYIFEASAEITRTISFNYLQTDVPGGNLYEGFLQVYYSPNGGQTWQPLRTELDTQDNLAAATMPGEQEGSGIYVLASSIPLPMLSEGWNQFAYPLPGSRSVTETLASIEGSYTSAYYYQSGGTPAWALHEATVLTDHPEFAAYLNDLHTIAFGEVYWIYATEPITPYIGLIGEGVRGPASFELPPATYYGWITPTLGFTPTAGMAVTATVNGVVCGQGTVTDTVGVGRLAYKLQVAASTGGDCGYEGQPAAFYVGGQRMNHDVLWDNSQAWFHSLMLVSQYDLTVVLDGNGSGTVSSVSSGIDCGEDCTALLDYGTVVTLTAAADLGSAFTGWSGACTGMGDCVLTMDAAQSVTATFMEIEFKVHLPLITR